MADVEHEELLDYDEEEQTTETPAGEDKIGETRGVRRGVSKGVEDGSRPLALWAATPETTIRTFQGWPPAIRKEVEHGGP
jgi:hypothetical protein